VFIAASAAIPPAINSAPIAARERGSPPGMRIDARPVSGSTVSAVAAASGSRLQPAIITNTSRNSTAVSAAETSPSAMSTARPLRAGVMVWVVVARPAHPHATAASTATGIWATKIACQSNACVSAPPSAGPAAAPAIAIAPQVRPPASARSIHAAVEIASAPPAPWTPRITSIVPSDPASAQPSDPAAKIVRPPAPRPAGSSLRRAAQASGSVSAMTPV
jgi:hypothetical protein